MDKTTETIAGFVESLTADQLPDETLQAAKARIVDAVGCAIGGLNSPPAVIARNLARATVGSNPSATAFGLDQPTSIELAVFANTVMVRYLDFNDMYFTPRGGGGHPSDLLATVLAVGEAVGSSGREVLLAATLAYEVNGALSSAVWLRERGWDQGLNIVAASALAAGKLLGLSETQLGNALSLAVTPNVPVRQTRVGELSMWKGCATAGAARNGVFAALLAQQGMTGPPEAYEGAAGIWALVTGPFQLELPARTDGFVIEHIATKTHPAEYNAQGPLDLITSLRPQVSLDNIDRIDVDTYFLAYDEIGSQIEKWDPQTRETADHSIPYLLAVALVDGKVGQGSFSQTRILDPDLRPLMNRIHVHHNEEYTARFPGELNCAVSIRLQSGETIEAHQAYPLGHPQNPVSEADLTEKFGKLARQYVKPHEAKFCDEVLAELWSLETLEDVAPVVQSLGRLQGE